VCETKKWCVGLRSGVWDLNYIQQEKVEGSEARTLRNDCSSL
jgi:hypothetical protein